jgi:hypothetical protein
MKSPSRLFKLFVPDWGKRVAVLYGSCLSMTFCSFSASVYVDPNAAGPTHNGTTWQYAFLTIQAGINASSNGDTIQVAPATYYENIDFKGKSITVQSSPLNASSTVIDGGANGTVVVFKTGETASSVLDGFTIQNGSVGYYFGGGITSSNASPTIKRCIIEENVSFVGGGALAWNASPTYWHCFFQNNSAHNAGSGLGAGAAHFFNGTSSFYNCVFVNNIADIGGGFGMSSSSSSDLPSATFHNCTFNGNVATNATYQGGGIVHWGTNLVISNSIVWGNSCNGNPSEIVTNGYNTTVVGYSDIRGGWTGTGNVNFDPLYSDAYHLNANSACIDAGGPLTVSISTDIDGQTRVVDADGVLSDGVDMGADELQWGVPDTDFDGVSDYYEVTWIVSSYLVADSGYDYDGDGLTLLEEYSLGTNPLNVTDSDGDGLIDGSEYHTYGTSVFLQDTDGDQISDYTEIMVWSSDPLSSDTDSDGMGDKFELTYWSTPTGGDPNADDDGDTFSNFDEFIAETDPLDVNSHP